MENFIGNIFPQNCGDTLLVIEKSEGRNFKCKFQKYPCEVYAQKGHIIRGNVYNPQIEQVEFIDKLWPQNCGDTLKILKKIKQNNWECESLIYHNTIVANKQKIIEGSVFNPLIFDDFLKKKYFQKCKRFLCIKEFKKGDYICYFEEYPFILFKAKKQDIINGNVKDTIIEEKDFFQKIWPQNCGDSLKIIDIFGKFNNKIFYNCEFINIPCKVKARKDNIKNGLVFNPNMDENYCREKLCSFIKRYKEKPTIKDLAKDLNLSRTYISNQIIKYDLRNLINYYPNLEEKYLYDFVKKYAKDAINGEWNKLEGKEIDIYIPSLNLGIEFNGNYWHCSKIKNNNYHQEKSLLAKEKGIKLIHIWEWELEYNKDNIENYLKSKLGFFNFKIFARKCSVKEINNKLYFSFCEENHLQGACGAKIKLGLFLENELIQIMSFGVPRFTDKYEWEIIRECSKQGYCIIGGKERLWSYFIKKYNPKNCISYCDFSKFTGDSYLKLGFKKERLNKPGFVWLGNDFHKIYWRDPYHNQEMKNKGYYKLYDCGQLVFSWTKDNNFK